MNRRDFLRRAAMLAGQLTVDPEFLLWVPKTLITVPATVDTWMAHGVLHRVGLPLVSWRMLYPGNTEDTAEQLLKLEARIEREDRREHALAQIARGGETQEAPGGPRYRGGAEGRRPGAPARPPDEGPVP